MVKFILWALVAGAAFAAESLTLMWVSSVAHDWWSMVPPMDFGSAFAVAVALSCAITVWKVAEIAIAAVNEL
jgi:hypothetical protein